MFPQTFVMYGASGSGKGTQAKILSEYLKEKDPGRGVLHISTGRILREFVKDHNTFIIQKTEKVMKEGGLLEAFIPIWAWVRFLIENYTGEEHLIFDGVARKKEEIPVLDGTLRFLERKNPNLLFLNVSEEEAARRLLKRGRSDDEAEDIKSRLGWFRESVIPLLDYYRKSEYFEFFDINGDETPEEIHQEIIKKIE